MALELVLLIPVLVLLTVFVLWAGRGGQVALTADLAAEEAATAAALCCGEGEGFGPDREAVVEDMLESRPGLGFLCIGGARPDAPPQQGGGAEFVSEEWMKFDPGRDTGGVGILGVRFRCETDGAVAPLAGLLSTVTFRGQATEVVMREPRFSVGFGGARFFATEGTDSHLVFTVTLQPRLDESVTLSYRVVTAATTAQPDDFVRGPADWEDLPLEFRDLPDLGQVVIELGTDSAEIRVPLFNDQFYEGDEELVLELTDSGAPDIVIDENRQRAVGVIEDNDPEPFLQIIEPYPEKHEEQDLTFVVRLGDSSGNEAPSAERVTVKVSTVEDPAAAGHDCSTWAPVGEACEWATAGADYEAQEATLTFTPRGSLTQSVDVPTLDDSEGEPVEIVLLELSEESGASVLQGRRVAGGRILDDEARVSILDAEADEGENLNFKLTLSQVPAAPVEIGYKLVDLGDPDAGDGAVFGADCADDGVDYVGWPGREGTVIISGSDQADIPAVVSCHDTLVEPDEVFWLAVSVLSGEAVPPDDGGAWGTIRNDDTPVIAVSDQTAQEAPADAPADGTLTFAVNLEVAGAPAQLAGEVSVSYAVEQHSPVSAEQGVDYAAPSGFALEGTLVFGPGTAAEQTVTVDLLADYEFEHDETFLLRLSDTDTSDYLALAEAVATGTILDDPPPVLSVDGFEGPEGSTGIFTVTLADDRGETVTVAYRISGDEIDANGDTATAPGHGTKPADFEPVPDTGPLTGTVTFDPGDTSRAVEVSLLRDPIADEPDETLRLTLANPGQAALFGSDADNSVAQIHGVGTITNVDPPELSVDDPGTFDPAAPVLEGETMTFTVTLERARAGETVTVDYAVVSQEAKSDEDFPQSPDFEAAPPGTLTLDFDNPTATVDVVTLTDKVAESAETLHLVLGQASPSHVRIAKAVGVGTITDVSPAIVRVNNPSAEEGDPLGFVISLVDLAGDPAQIRTPVTVEYYTSDRSAVAGADEDYTAVRSALAPASVTFGPGGATTHPVPVQTLTDTRDERDETMALVLGVDPDNDAATLGDTEGTGTIIDVTPALRILDATAEEGDPLTFRVTLVDNNRQLTSTSEIVSFTVSTEDGTATDADDYTASSQRLEIPAGESGVDFEVETLPDGNLEPPETVRAVLSEPRGALTDRGVATGTITEPCITIHGDDDPGDLFLFAKVEHELAFGGNTRETLVGLRAPVCEATAVQLRDLGDGTAISGLSGALGDYSVINRGFLFPNSFGYNRALVSAYLIFDDELREDDETFTVEINWASTLPPKFQGKEPSVAVFTIADDDPEPNLRVAEASAREGEAMTFEVALDARSGREVTVQYRTVPGSGTATQFQDYTPADWTMLRFMRDDTGRTPLSQTFTVQTYSDADDVDDTFWVELRNPVNADIGDGVAIGTILEYPLPQLRIHDARADEGDDLAFVVELSEAASQPVTVDYETVQRPAGPRSATAGVDYTPAPAGASLTFGVGDPLTQTIYVAALDDGIEPEADETFLLELSGAVGASLADPSAVGTINGEVSCIDAEDPGEVPPGWTAGLISAPEDAGPMVFSFELDEPYCHAASFYANTSIISSATSGVDFERVAGPFTIAPLQTVVSVEVPLIDDDINEDDEIIWMRFAEASFSPVEIPEFNLMGTIIDDDGEVVVSVDDTTTTGEGDYLTFTVRLDRPSERAVTVDYATEDDAVPSAAAAVDYTPAGSTVTIPAGQLSATVRVRTLQDVLDEDDETLGLRLSNPQVRWSPPVAAVLAPGGEVGVGTIVDDDDPPAVRVSNPAADEGGVLVFEVTLDAPSGRDASVSFVTRDGPTTGGGATVVDDYVYAFGTRTFAAGETAKTVAVQSLTDDDTEGDEHFFLDLSSTDLRFDKDVGTGTIRDVTRRRVSVSDAVVDEGGVLSFVVGFDEPPTSRDITVAYRTVAVTAEAGDDYGDDFESVPGEVRILAGRTFAVVGVPTVQDSLDEDLEQLRLVLSDPVGAVLVGGGEAVGTIRDDDPEPLLSVDNPEATENGDGTPVTFTLHLSEVSGRDVSVRYSTVDIDSAKPGEDYVAESGEPVTIPAGAQTAQAPVGLVNDDVEEEVERFQLRLWDPSNARFDDDIGVATILDDDALPQILIDDAAATYEAAGASVSFVVRLSRADPDAAVTVDYATEDATATAGDDYTQTSLTLTFAAGDTAATVTVELVDDDIVEDTETFRLRLSNPSSNATLGNDSAVATVLDDDALPELSVSDAPAATEGTAATFTVELSRSSARPATVAYAAVVDPFGGDAAAIPGQDFEAVTGRLTIAARSTSATVTVPLPDDALDEHTETFWLRLADPTDATVDDGTGVGTITDDDPLPQLNIGDSGATEGDPIRFTVTLDPTSGRTVTVPWTTADSVTGDPASANNDYVAASGTLTFPSGTTAVHIDVETLQDDISEPDETFQIQLGQPTDATVDDGVAAGAIRDDDGLPRISIAGVEITEDKSPAIFVVTLSHTSSQSITMEYFTTEDSATAGDDYGTPDGEATGTLVIPAGFDTGEISVFILDDQMREGTETFWITLHNPQNAVIAEGAGTAVGVILDDDVPRVSIGDADALEADGTIYFPVTLSFTSDDPVTVRYTTFDGSATQPDDYIAVSATLTIPASSTDATIAVTLTDDPFEEDAESMLVRLSDPSDGSEIRDAEAVGVILDDDSLPVLKGEPVDVAENEGTLTYTVTLSRPSDKEVSVDYRTVVKDRCGGPAHRPFTNVSGTLVFAPGAVVQTVDVPLVDNDQPCPGQLDHWQVQLELTNPVNATVDDSIPLIAYIWDDEHVPRLGLEPRREEAIESAGEVVFTIIMRRSDAVDVTVPYRAGELSALAQIEPAFEEGEFIGKRGATAPDDFAAETGIATIPAGRRSTTISVPIVDDSNSERAEHFGLLLTLDASEYRIDNVAHTALGRIIDDDGASLSVDDIEVSEGAGSAFFRVILDGPSTQIVTVQYATADGTAAQPGDYAEASGELRLEAGAVEAIAEVSLVDDTVDEADETFTLTLSGASGAAISDAAATATIRDDDGDDALPVLTVMDGSAPEQGPFGFDSASFHYTLSRPSTDTITFRYETVEAPWLGDRAATARTDYQVRRRTISIPPGDTEGQFSVDHVDDPIHEHDEMYIIWLSDPTDAVLGTNVVWGTILNDDAPPVPIVSIADATASESDGFIEFVLDLHEPGLDPATVRYTTLVRHSEGDAAASPGDDYAHTEGRLTIPAGVTTITIPVRIIGDNIDEEPNETFLLELSEPEGLTFSKSAAVGTIVDDDPGWVIDDPDVWEDAGSMVFTVIRDHTGTSAVTLTYTVTRASAVGGDSCTTGVDYITPSGSVTLPPAATQAEITVQICDDDVAEGSETLLIELTGVPGRKLTGTGTIVDDHD